MTEPTIAPGATERYGEVRGDGVIESSRLLAWLREHPDSALARWVRKEER